MRRPVSYSRLLVAVFLSLFLSLELTGGISDHLSHHDAHCVLCVLGASEVAVRAEPAVTRACPLELAASVAEPSSYDFRPALRLRARAPPASVLA